jgi:hypothetical protein
MKFGWKIYFLISCVVVFLNGCEQSNDVALLSSYPAFGSCAIDTPKAGERISSGKNFNVGGWAFDEKNKSLPDTLTLYFVNEDTSAIFTFSAKRGPKRGDVAAVFKLPTLIDSGFSGHILGNSLTPGTYRIILLQADRQAGVISCNGLDHKIIVH